jgi:alkaline phosphatase D
MKYILPVLLLFTISCHSNKSINIDNTTNIRIAFGSCADQNKPQPLLEVATNLAPDAFIFLGDNIYGDTEDMTLLREKYITLEKKPEFQALKASTTIYAVWDDHDYGENDAGKYYPQKEKSKEIFMDFWNVPESSPRRKHNGIYGVEYLRKDNLIVQLILLDTRTFRSDLTRRKVEDTTHKNDYIPNQNPDSTILGKEQWQWLEQTLTQEADVRIIASSNQFSHEYNGWESWTNVPHEQQKMLAIINKTQANGVIFISGDVHWGEISKLNNDITYPIYDVTSSGITQTWYNTEPNKNRIGEVIPQNNIGAIDISQQGKNIRLKMAIYDETGKAVVWLSTDINEVSF